MAHASPGHPNATVLQGGGDMGSLMRAFDWSQTAVGASAFWPQSLRTALSLLLESKFPMLLCWGKDFIQAAALQIAASFAPQVALLDLGLPVMDGYELAERLQHAPTRPFLIALTGYSRRHTNNAPKRWDSTCTLASPLTCTI